MYLVVQLEHISILYSLLHAKLNDAVSVPCAHLNHIVPKTSSIKMELLHELSVVFCINSVALCQSDVRLMSQW